MFRQPLLIVLALLVPGLAAGAIVLPLTRAELASRADTIVRARVVQRTPVRSEKTGRILTRSRLAVIKTYKGEPRAELELEQMGGTLDGATLLVPGDARIDSGEEVVLFLRCQGKERCHIYGLSLGKFGVRTLADGRQVAVRDLKGLTDPKGVALESDEVSLPALERELGGRP
jgi:hypothetical protein